MHYIYKYVQAYISTFTYSGSGMNHAAHIHTFIWMQTRKTRITILSLLTIALPNPFSVSASSGFWYFTWHDDILWNAVRQESVWCMHIPYVISGVTSALPIVTFILGQNLSRSQEKDWEWIHSKMFSTESFSNKEHPLPACVPLYLPKKPMRGGSRTGLLHSRLVEQTYTEKRGMRKKYIPCWLSPKKHCEPVSANEDKKWKLSPREIRGEGAPEGNLGWAHYPRWGEFGVYHREASRKSGTGDATDRSGTESSEHENNRRL